MEKTYNQHPNELVFVTWEAVVSASASGLETASWSSLNFRGHLGLLTFDPRTPHTHSDHRTTAQV